MNFHFLLHNCLLKFDLLLQQLLYFFPLLLQNVLEVLSVVFWHLILLGAGSSKCCVAGLVLVLCGILRKVATVNEFAFF